MSTVKHLALPLSVLLASCGQADFGAKFDGSIEDRVKFVAKTAGAILPGMLGGHVKFVETRAEGRTLVIKLDTDIEGSTAGSSEELSKLFRPQVCGNDGYRRLIDEGAAIKFEIVRSKYGDKLEPFAISYCG